MTNTNIVTRLARTIASARRIADRRDDAMISRHAHIGAWIMDDAMTPPGDLAPVNAELARFVSIL